MTQAEMAEALEIQPISLVRLIDRLCEQRPGRAPPAPARPPRQPALPDREGPGELDPPDAARPRGRADVLDALERGGDAELLHKLLRIKDNIRQRGGSARRHRRRGSPPGTRKSCLHGHEARGSAARGSAGVIAHKLLLVVPAIVAAGRALPYLMGGRFVSTDNAYVGAQKVLITPEVSGKVVSIAVVEGQLLKPGDELFSIDAEPYRFAAQEAEAKLARIRSDFDNLKSTLRQPRQADRAGAPERRRRAGRLRPQGRAARQPHQRALGPRQVAHRAGRRQGAARAAPAAGSDGPQSAAGRCRAPVEKYPHSWRRPWRSTAPSAISPTPCCARPSPASPRR